MSQYVVEPAKIARRLGIDLETEPKLTERISDAILDAQADVLAYLRRDSLFPVEKTLHGLYPAHSELGEPAAWPQAKAVFDDTFTVSSYTADGQGTYTVVFDVGLDGRNEPPIVRYVTAHAIESLRNDPLMFNTLPQKIRTVSAGNQSISYQEGSVAEGAAGSLPNIKTLAPYRRLAIYRRPTAPATLWPYF